MWVQFKKKISRLINFDFSLSPLLRGGWLMLHRLVVGGYLQCQTQLYCVHDLKVFDYLAILQWQFTFHLRKITSGLALKKCPPSYIQTMEQTDDGTDKTNFFNVPLQGGTAIFQKCPPSKCSI